jgi:hypothetical protein
MIMYSLMQQVLQKTLCLPWFSLLVVRRDLSGNQLTGSIPPSVWNMISQLHVLDVSENQLSGNFPSGINFTESNAQCPQSLATLNVFGNNFQGTFPPDLFNCSASKLQEINFDHNNFNGTLDMQQYVNYLGPGDVISMAWRESNLH